MAGKIDEHVSSDDKSDDETQEHDIFLVEKIVTETQEGVQKEEKR